MAYSLSPLLKPRFFVNVTNKPLVGGKLYTYLAETTTPATTYSNDTGTPNTNPIILDANGECNLYLDDDKVYRLILKDANDVTYFDKDRVSSIGGGDFKVLSFNTVDDLRLKIGSEKEPVAQTSGYYNAGDGGGNSFYWDGTSAATDNGGTIIKPTFVSGAGRWLALNKYSFSVAQFGAYGDGVHDDSPFIQAAINTGANVELLNGKTYYASNLTMTTDRQVLFCKGLCRIVKNANGVILTASGVDQQLQNIAFRGDASPPTFTGDNVNATGTGFTMLNCGSRWAYGRAVKSTKSYTRIIGTCDIYQTSDATGSGYDIELGQSGQVALYCHVSGTISTQATGGILCVETGTISVDNCQFGKFTAQKGANGSGNSSPRLSNCRVNGDVSIAQSNGTFTGNQFSSNFTFEFGSSLNTLDLSNVWAVGSVITNSGNANNYIAKNVSTGGTFDVRLGDDTSNMKMVYTLGGAVSFPDSITMLNAKSIILKDSTGSTSSSSLSLSASNALTLFSNHASGTINIYSAAGVNTYAGGTMKNQTTSAGTFRAASDNVYQLGDSGQRWSVVFAGTGTINTSDERLKQQISYDLAPELKAWAKVNFCKYKFNDAVEIKGDGARWHFGVIAQEVKAAFESEGLDPFAYGILCYDEWDAEEEVLDEVLHDVLDDDGNVVDVVKTVVIVNKKRDSGNRYGVRYEEALILECAYLRSKIK